VVLTFRPAKASPPARGARAIGAAFAVSVVISLAGLVPATAQQIKSGGCVDTWHSFNCVTRWAPAGDPYVRTVPQPLDAAAIARVKEREHRWAERCRPTITPDRYGVPRYSYAAPGCEFGVGEN
jgi:hypothetical protein